MDSSEAESPRGGNWFEDNPWKARLLLLLFVFLFVELGVRALVGLGSLHHRTYPASRKAQFWAYVDPVVGMWKRPNVTFRHRDQCIDQTYRSNSFGARDVERLHSSSAGRRAVVLGDSFVEGYGVRDEVRFTNLLEERTGIEHLNFGASGHFSVIQAWLLYDSYARKYDHTDVLLFILPFNDYADNHPDNFHPKAYRPFLRLENDEFQVWYPVEFEGRHTINRSAKATVKNAIANHIYLYNQLRRLREDSRPRPTWGAEPPNTYDDFSEEDLGALLHALDELSTLAGDRRLYVFTIPMPIDLAYAKKHGPGFALVRALQRFAAEHENTEYLDLVPHFLQYAREQDIALDGFTLGCDLHWGAVGHEAAAQVVYEFVYANDETAGDSEDRR